MSKTTFKKLTDKDKEYIVNYHDNNSHLTYEQKQAHLAAKYEVTNRTISNWWKQLGISKSTLSHTLLHETTEYAEAKKRNLQESKFYIVTYEQNETPLHQEFFKNILAYKEFLGAELSVILGTYRNPTSNYPDQQKLYWNEASRPYWDAGRHQIHKYVSVVADLPVVPTAKMPLSSLESMGGRSSFIIGHPKLQLKAAPVLKGHPKKIMMTTGAITVPNYTRSKAGIGSKDFHKLGFVIVEVRNDEIFHMRQVEADANGTFYDICHKVHKGKVKKINKIRGLVWGDIHHRFLDKRLEKETFKFMNKIKPDFSVYHDVLDGDSVNHWESKDPIKSFQREQAGRNNVKKEIDEVLKWVEKITPFNPIIVRSNHDEWLDRWIVNSDWKKDVKNSIEYMEYAQVLLKGEAPKGLLPYLIEEKFGDQVICLDIDNSFMIDNYEVGHHGYYGQNGSKGNINQFKRLNTDVIVGDYHTPTRYDKALGVGTSTYLKLDYNKGASSWLQAHAIIHKNNTAQHIIFVEGKFTTFKY